MSGYLGEKPLAQDAWFDTGDLGEFDAAGYLHLHARRTDLIVSGGENVYPAEVERVLEDCPGIEAAAVFGVPDETWGQLVAVVLVASAPHEHALDAERESQLLQFLAGRLAVYKRPRRVVWVSSAAAHALRQARPGDARDTRAGLASAASEKLAALTAAARGLGPSQPVDFLT